MSLAQSDYCHKHNYDPEDPRCAHIILTGRVQQVKKELKYEFFVSLILKVVL